MRQFVPAQLKHPPVPPPEILIPFQQLFVFCQLKNPAEYVHAIPTWPLLQLEPVQPKHLVELFLVIPPLLAQQLEPVELKRLVGQHLEIPQPLPLQLEPVSPAFPLAHLLAIPT